MSDFPKIVIVGAGHAAGYVLQSLAKSGVKGGVTLISDEPYAPYQRPPLSKKYLAGDMDKEGLMLLRSSFFDDFGYEFVKGQKVTSIDRDEKRVMTGEGDSVSYDKLILATGTRARPLSVPGTELNGVHYLRGIGDVEGIKAKWPDAQSLVVIGGGFIGLEVAAVARGAGKQVTIIEMQDRLMPRVVAPLVSDFYRDIHEGHGVEICVNSGVDEILGEGGQVTGVISNGREIQAQMVIIGIGVLANDELASDCGLECDAGIFVDEFTRTDDLDIFAVGDCTRHYNPLYQRRLRLESVHNAVEQGKTAATTILGEAGQGSAKPYGQIPWFWSDQYDLKLQMVGLSDGYDETIVRGDIENSAFSVFYYQRDKLIAVDSINRPADHLMSRKLLGGNISVPKDKAGDADFNLKELL